MNNETKGRIFVFCGDNYYPRGGFYDCIGAVEHSDEISDLVATFIKMDYGDIYRGWFHAFDATTGKFILAGSVYKGQIKILEPSDIDRCRTRIEELLTDNNPQP